MIGGSKKKNNEIYYDEAIKYFPYEFQMLFKNIPSISQRMPNLNPRNLNIST